MKRASVTEAKNSLSALIDGLANGSPVLIVDRGRPVARLEPVEGEEPGGRLARLERRGMVRTRRRPLPTAITKTPPPKPAAGASALKTLLDERRSGR